MIKNRQTNVELLRIIAMLMVLGLHANFTALKAPSAENIITIGGLSRVFLESICIVAVNVFVMISGWFGIRATLRGFFNFIWQVIYCVGLLTLVGICCLQEPFTSKTIFWIVGLYGGGGWFVASYIGLYILSPMLNAFLEKSSTKSMVSLLAAFFAFEILWGNTKSVEFVVGGYSTFSFIGIYLLAGLLRRLQLNYKPRIYLGVFLIVSMINTGLYVVTVMSDLVAVRDMLFNYINPLVIVGAASLLLAFVKITPPDYVSVYQRIILWVSASSFAAYLLHVGVNYAFKFYCDGAKIAYNSSSGLGSFIMVIGYIFCVFIAAVLIDQPRKLVWNKLLLTLFKNK